MVYRPSLFFSKGISNVVASPKVMSARCALYLSRDGTPQSREKAMHLIEQVYTALDSQEDSHEL